MHYTEKGPPFLLHIFFSAGDRILSFELKILGKYLDEEGIRICDLLVDHFSECLKTFSWKPSDHIFVLWTLLVQFF